ncbi:hypothetical protein [Luteococcus peritonei]|uniref:Uncharacterized protein n=1 Tax=Luteococcus peritonei TaxID=88874 RepID=A0ABW4RWY6_9ACTN
MSNPYAPDHDQDPGSPDLPDAVGPDATGSEDVEQGREQAEVRSADAVTAPVGEDDFGLPASEGAAEDAARAQGL